jgi:hypothetical protein
MPRPKSLAEPPCTLPRKRPSRAGAPRADLRHELLLYLGVIWRELAKRAPRLSQRKPTDFQRFAAACFAAVDYGCRLSRMLILCGCSVPATPRNSTGRRFGSGCSASNEPLRQSLCLYLHSGFRRLHGTAGGRPGRGRPCAENADLRVLRQERPIAPTQPPGNSAHAPAGRRAGAPRRTRPRSSPNSHRRGSWRRGGAFRDGWMQGPGARA